MQIRVLKHQGGKCNPHGNHKENSYRIGTEEDEKWLKHFTTKQLNTKEDRNAGVKDGKAVRHIYNKEQNDRSSSCVNILNANQLNSLIQRDNGRTPKRHSAS